MFGCFLIWQKRISKKHPTKSTKAKWAVWIWMASRERVATSQQSPEDGEQAETYRTDDKRRRWAKTSSVR